MPLECVKKRVLFSTCCKEVKVYIWGRSQENCRFLLHILQLAGKHSFRFHMLLTVEWNSKRNVYFFLSLQNSLKTPFWIAQFLKMWNYTCKWNLTRNVHFRFILPNCLKNNVLDTTSCEDLKLYILVKSQQKWRFSLHTSKLHRNHLKKVNFRSFL